MTGSKTILRIQDGAASAFQKFHDLFRLASHFFQSCANLINKLVDHQITGITLLLLPNLFGRMPLAFLATASGWSWPHCCVVQLRRAHHLPLQIEMEPRFVASDRGLCRLRHCQLMRSVTKLRNSLTFLTCWRHAGPNLMRAKRVELNAIQKPDATQRPAFSKYVSGTSRLQTQLSRLEIRNDGAGLPTNGARGKADSGRWSVGGSQVPEPNRSTSKGHTYSGTSR